MSTITFSRWIGKTADPYEMRGCVFCTTMTTGTVRVGLNDWYVCDKHSQDAQNAAKRLVIREKMEAKNVPA